MADHRCIHCGNRYHWREAFSKFGYDDGDGKVETPSIARLLQDCGYTVKYSRWGPHNTIIFSIQKDGIEHMPLHDTRFVIGYDDPQIYLPECIQDILNQKVPPVMLFQPTGA